MRVRLVRRPGQHGTGAYVKQYGDLLVCVRYRYDAQAKRRYKTIEIIVEEGPWEPPAGPDELPPGAHGDAGRATFEPSTLVGLRLPARRPELIAQLRLAGAERRELLDVWVLRFDTALAYGLADCIVDSVERLAAEWNSRTAQRPRRG
jgi:hypothetical protein